MSLVTLQFGQCGNQIGQSLYGLIQDDILSKREKNQINVEAVNKWFHVNDKGIWHPRSILIDTETKVVDNLKVPNLKFNSVVAKSFGGSANNWAFGYTENSKLVISDVLNCVRCELEKSDFMTSVLNIYSLSGGTGSGVVASVWSDVEKTQLLFALRTYGDTDYFKIQSVVPTKCITEIREKISEYKKTAEKRWLYDEDRKNDEILNWIQVFKHVKPNEKGRIEDIIPRVLKYIGLFEKNAEQSDIHIGKLYSFLANVSYGNPKDLSERAKYLLYQSLVQLAENLEKQDVTPSLSFLRTLTNLDDIKQNPDESLINALKFPDNLLKPNPVDFDQLNI